MAQPYSHIQWADNLLNKEKGFSPSTHKPLSMVLVYPNTYHVGMSSIGFQSIFFHVNQHPDLFCDRGFCDNAIGTIGLHTKQPLRNFDIIAFSVSYELDYFNIVSVLRSCGLTPDRTQRPDTDPLILIGGIAPTINPAPLALIADVIAIGDGEQVIHRIADHYTGQKTRSGQMIIESLADIPGVYCPGITASGRKIDRQVITDLDTYPSQSFIITKNTEFSGKFVIELGRGCGRRCTFCAADYIYPRPRIRSANAILDQIDRMRVYTNSVGLLGVAVASHPDFERIMTQLEAWNMEASISSLRVEGITEHVARFLIKAGQKSVTLAPETGSDALRQTLNKRFSNELLLEKIRLFVTFGLKEIKLYFMIGLPDETDADITAIAELARETASMGVKVKLNINPFIPKPHTPMQYEGMPPQIYLKNIIKQLRHLFRTQRRIQTSFASLRLAYTEALLSRADSELGKQVLIDNRYQMPKSIDSLNPNAGPYPWQIVNISPVKA